MKQQASAGGPWCLAQNGRPKAVLASSCSACPKRRSRASSASWSATAPNAISRRCCLRTATRPAFPRTPGALRVSPCTCGPGAVCCRTGLAAVHAAAARTDPAKWQPVRVSRSADRLPRSCSFGSLRLRGDADPGLPDGAVGGLSWPGAGRRNHGASIVKRLAAVLLGFRRWPSPRWPVRPLPRPAVAEPTIRPGPLRARPDC